MAYYGLTRILRTENDWSDLISLLTERDPEGLRSALKLDAGSIEVVRERHIKSGRLDILVLLDGSPVAIIEVKLGAEAHGDQFSVYDAWAEKHGVPVGQRYIVGPNEDPIPDVPDTWSQAFTIASLLEAWAHSDDDLARPLATEARRYFLDLEEQATGPADAAKSTLADVIRLRRAQHHVLREASPEVTFAVGGRSQIGAPNISAWRDNQNERVTAELQRFAPRAGVATPLAFKVMVRVLGDDDQSASVELAHRQEDWLAPRSIMHSAGELRALVADPNGDGIKAEGRGGKGHERYYGYKSTGLGTTMHLRPDITLEQLVQLYAHVAEYLTTYEFA